MNILINGFVVGLFAGSLGLLALCQPFALTALFDRRY